MMRFALLIVAALLPACARTIPPTIAAASQNNLVTYREGQATLQQAFVFAENYCRALGKGSHFRQTQRVNDFAVLDFFDCVGPASPPPQPLPEPAAPESPPRLPQA